jgi:hypothetical protein
VQTFSQHAGAEVFHESSISRKLVIGQQKTFRAETVTQLMHFSNDAGDGEGAGAATPHDRFRTIDALVRAAPANFQYGNASRDAAGSTIRFEGGNE